MAKKKGGVGQHVTANTPRTFSPNLKTKRIWVPELNRYVAVKLSARALKTITKNGAFNTLKKAGLV
jgi:large subunit ribosomal protein L28